MKSRNIGYIPEIDHLRLLAALLIFFFHFFHLYLGGWKPYPEHPLFGLVTEGHTGVALFFVLSGFIFMRIALSGGDIGYGQFLRNRLLRIAPLFLVIFVVAISIGRDKFQASDLLYMFVTNIGDAPTSWHFVTGPAWSISVEFTFYMIFPFIAAFTRVEGSRYLLKLMLLLLVVKAAAYMASPNSTLMLYSTLIGRLDQFFVGMLAAIVYVSRREQLEANARFILPAAIVLVVAGVGIQAHWFSFFAPEKHHPAWIIWGTVEAALWALVIIGYLAARIPWPSLIETALRKGGECSFSFYMWHALVMYLAHEAIGPVGGTGYAALALNAIILLAVTTAFARLSYTTIERPFLSMRQRYVHAETTGAPQ